MGDRWDETGTWIGDGLRREVFFFSSEGGRLYGSIYAAASPPASAVALCNSWGYEGNQSDATMQAIALATARAGGAALLFHYPGFGDSEGDLAEATMATMVNAAVDAVREATRRLGAVSWTLGGLMMGAPVAALAAERAGIAQLLLIQPVLRSSPYFAKLERSARRAAIRVPARRDNAYGYPLPRRILDAAPAIDLAVAEALGDFPGEGAVVRYAEPPREQAIPGRFEDVVLPGTWRFGARQRPELAQATIGWLLGAAVEAGG